jgi:hypothetical protein
MTAGVLILTSCTRATSDKSQVTIKFPEATSASSKVSSKLVGALSTKWQLASPSTKTDVNCYALAVKLSEGTHSISCSSSAAVSVLSADMIIGGFPAGTETTVEIPSGDNREISLIGFNTDDTSLCGTIAETGGTFPVGNFSPPVIINTLMKTIQGGEDSVEFTVPASLSGLPVFEDCSPKSFASETQIKADVSGMPSGISNTNALNITVSGYNISEYRYAVTSNLSCAGVTYSPYRSIGFHITDNNLPDGQTLLCVLGKTAGGIEQVSPTVKTWIIDTTSSVATGISLASSVGNNDSATVTVSGTTTGDSVEIFRGPSPCMNSIGTAVASGSSVALTPSSPFAEGTNTITAIITDVNGNVGACSSVNSVSATYNLDTTPPAAVSGILDNVVGSSLFYTPLYTWAATTDSNSGVKSYEVQLDSGAWVDVGTNLYYYSLQSLSGGSAHSFSVRAVDNAGNRGVALTDTFTVNNAPLWKQQAYAKASNADPGDSYGSAVAIDGDFMVVGAPLESSAQQGPTNSALSDTTNTVSGTGAAYVYHRDFSGQWVQTAFLKAAVPEADDHFGNSVSISGNTIVVGAYKEKSSSNSIINLPTGDSPQGSTNETGAAYVFVYDGANWSQQAYLKAPNTPSNSYSWFGYSVAVEKDTIVVGAPILQDTHTGVFTSPPNAVASGTTTYGGAYIFKRSGTSWAVDAYLKPPQVHADMRFGDKVAIASGTVVVSAPNESSRYAAIINGTSGAGPLDGVNDGAVYVFKNSGGTWQQDAYLKPSNIGDNDFFGSSVAIFNDKIVVGAKGEDSSGSSATYGSIADNDLMLNAGAVYVFRHTASAWVGDSYLKASNLRSGDNFGTAVAIWGSTIVVGSSGESSCANAVLPASDLSTNCSFAGAVYAYQASSLWSESSYFKASNNNSVDTPFPSSAYGSSVAISGATIVIGNEKEYGSTNSIINGSGAVNFTGNSPGAGSVYIYFPY